MADDQLSPNEDITEETPAELEDDENIQQQLSDAAEEPDDDIDA